MKKIIQKINNYLIRRNQRKIDEKFNFSGYFGKIDKKQKIWWFAFVKNVIIIFVKRFRKKEEISMHKYGPVIKMLSLVTQIGITMLTSVFLCMAIGMWIDKHFSTNLFLLFLILGIMGGIRGVYSLIHNILEQEDMEDKDER